MGGGIHPCIKPVGTTQRGNPCTAVNEKVIVYRLHRALKLARADTRRFRVSTNPESLCIADRCSASPSRQGDAGSLNQREQRRSLSGWLQSELSSPGSSPRACAVTGCPVCPPSWVPVPRLSTQSRVRADGQSASTGTCGPAGAVTRSWRQHSVLQERY